MPKEQANRDDNFVTTLLGVDMSTGLLPTKVYVDETTHRLLVSAVISSPSDLATEATLAKTLTPIGNNFDYIGITNTGADEDTLVFKTGGSGGDTVKTLIIGYVAGVDKVSDNITSLEYS